MDESIKNNNNKVTNELKVKKKKIIASRPMQAAAFQKLYWLCCYFLLKHRGVKKSS